ncbi:MAG: Smt3-specific protease [Stictis urceolatum]|nr:Smt3-specific protease [Stictis urceolata]
MNADNVMEWSPAPARVFIPSPLPALNQTTISVPQRVEALLKADRIDWTRASVAAHPSRRLRSGKPVVPDWHDKFSSIPRARSFDEFCRDEAVQTGRNGMSQQQQHSIPGSWPEEANDTPAKPSALWTIISSRARTAVGTVRSGLGMPNRALTATTRISCQGATSTKRRLVETVQVTRVACRRLPRISWPRFEGIANLYRRHITRSRATQQQIQQPRSPRVNTGVTLPESEQEDHALPTPPRDATPPLPALEQRNVTLPTTPLRTAIISPSRPEQSASAQSSRLTQSEQLLPDLPEPPKSILRRQDGEPRFRQSGVTFNNSPVASRHFYDVPDPSIAMNSPNTNDVGNNSFDSFASIESNDSDTSNNMRTETNTFLNSGYAKLIHAPELAPTFINNGLTWLDTPQEGRASPVENFSGIEPPSNQYTSVMDGSFADNSSQLEEYFAEEEPVRSIENPNEYHDDDEMEEDEDLPTNGNRRDDSPLQRPASYLGYRNIASPVTPEWTQDSSSTDSIHTSPRSPLQARPLLSRRTVPLADQHTAPYSSPQKTPPTTPQKTPQASPQVTPPITPLPSPKTPESKDPITPIRATIESDESNISPAMNIGNRRSSIRIKHSEDDKWAHLANIQLDEDLQRQVERVTALEAKRREDERLAEMERERRSYRRTSATAVLAPISAEWEARLATAMASAPHRELTDLIGNTRLARKDFGTLLPQPGTADPPNGWLNDDIIMAGLQQAVGFALEKSGHRRNAIPKYHSFNTFFYKNLSDKGPDGVARWAHRAKFGGESLLSTDYVFIPVNPNNIHWTLLVVMPSRRKVEYFDSMHGSSTTPLNRIKQWLKFELKDKFVEEEWKFCEGVSPTQTNGSDCGVFVITTAKMIMLGLDPEKSYGQRDMRVQRKRIACELISGSYIGDFLPTEYGEPGVVDHGGRRRGSSAA